MNKFKITLVAAVLLGLTACQQTQVSTESAVNLPVNFSQQGTAQIDLSQWWNSWNDPVLSSLINKGLAQNLDYKLALSRLNEAQAGADYSEADKGINVSGSVSGGGSYSDMNMYGTDRESKGLNGYGGLSASWEADFFGKKSSDSDAARFQRDAVQQQAYSAKMLISSNIAQHYINARAIQQQQVTSNQQIAELNKLARYVKGRFNAGQATAYEVSEIETQITQAKAQQTTLNSQYTTEVRAIAVLLGEVPQGFTLPDSRNILANLPKAPVGSTPEGWLERRPDLQAQRYSVQAAAAKVASAKADLYPRFSLSFMADGGKMQADGDTVLKGWMSMVSVGINVPLFTNGRIQANIDKADAALQSALLEYDRTLLNGLAEVDNAYHQQYTQARQSQLFAQSLTQANKQANDAVKLFQNGNKTLDSTINARINAINVQNQLIQSQRQQALSLVSLYKALGGGW
ncbi:efflux transporter outer membrane subunit [Lonepinella sp. BR2357]|uniref:efflux transporter outer membrane subunit n=1 Tax=Lonepinella sp. BR2357 TaxID=3434549 RepID=UPI003F6E0333